MNALKYRTLTSREPPKTSWYNGIRLMTNEGNCISTDGYVIAVGWQSASGGAVGFLAYGKNGKITEPPLLRVHSRPINDMSFSPCQPNLFITCSDDGTVKYWKPDGMNPSKSLNLLSLSMSKPVPTFALHPCAADICLAGCNDKTVRLWDAHEGKQTTQWILGDNPYSITWDYQGTLAAVTAKDKNVYVIDPRAPEIVGKNICHPGNRATRCTWMGRKNMFLTTGSDTFQTKKVAVWDPRNLSAPLKEANVGSGTGITIPMYDADLDIFYLSTKGEGSVKVYEVNDEKVFTDINTFNSDNSSKGICMVPKHSLDIFGCEVGQLLKAVNGAIVPVSMYMTRKTKGFHEDLFPVTAACKPSMTAADFLSGKNAPRQQMSLSGAAAATAAAQPVVASSQPGATAPAPSASSNSYGGSVNSYSSTSNSSSVQLGYDVHDTSIQYDRNLPQDTQEHVDYGAKHTFVLFKKDNKKEEEEKKEVRQKVNIGPIVRYSKFKNINSEPYMKNTNHDEIRVNSNCNTLISINEKFFAVPTKGVGGHLLIHPFEKVGRIATEHPCILVGSEITTMQWNPFDNHCIATGSEDAHVKIWRIPQNGLTSNLETAEVDLVEHKRKIQTLNWHPTAKNVLVSSAVDNIVKFWDVSAKVSVIDLYGHTDSLFSLNFNWTGSKVITACKDKNMRIWDPRANDPLVAETLAHDGAKGFTCTFAGRNDNLIVSAGFSKDSARMVKLWDTRNFSKAISEIKLDALSGILGIWYDDDNDVFALYGKGDGNMRFYEIAKEDGKDKLFFLTETSAGKSVADLDFFPRHATDVRKCELALSARLVGSPPSVLERVSYIVPRTRMEFFQDDIFPPTRSFEPTYTASEWFSNSTKQVQTVSRCPQGMSLLSTAPQIEHKAKYHMPSDSERNEGQTLTRDAVFDKFYSRMKDVQEEMGPGVDEAEMRKKEVEEGLACADDEWDDE